MPNPRSPESAQPLSFQPELSPEQAPTHSEVPVPNAHDNIIWTHQIDQEGNIKQPDQEPEIHWIEAADITNHELSPHSATRLTPSAEPATEPLYLSEQFSRNDSPAHVQISPEELAYIRHLEAEQEADQNQPPGWIPAFKAKVKRFLQGNLRGETPEQTLLYEGAKLATKRIHDKQQRQRDRQKLTT
jgi:hypothetical protein